MRIISGKFKSKRIIAPKKLPIRPTTDIAKEGLFNILNNRIHFQDISVLDLFSGSGNITYEFISRGTQNITAVDQHYGCVKFIKETSLELEGSVNTIKSDVFKYLEKVNTKFDLIFADPPYDFSEELFENIVQLVFENDFLEEDGVLIIEHSKHTEHLKNHTYFTEERRYGGSVFSFFSKS
ncbi:16S rRNA (guanine(966)-N(2))-methyltransferase RsmD [Mesonia sp. K4-1]|uniref:16S rRNA (guanine(966)-N(2))-methyltransferase RsmD n=1 Tax=Mesonia sp. K4-1 TaxID=2602760 RepID=UPI0011C7CC96|nr:16S rRNA (guanine(966)-N(2))-methyltransferase RsmD [Mesonia sp. K4-1]TXK72980.1 16S rRNA (guanine(966)-N(2))-methyltransferase RsmD [Mesonia sp. K4-1]